MRLRVKKETNKRKNGEITHLHSSKLMGELELNYMDNLTTTEGVVNNSNQPSQTDKLSQMINKRITDLTEQLGKISNEITELKSIQVTDEIRKIVVGSTEFNIEDFMSVPDITKYRNWLEVKKELEGKNDEEISDVVNEELQEKWNYDWCDYVNHNCDWDDFDVTNYLDFSEFIERYLDPSDYELDGVRDDFYDGFTREEILEDYIKDNI